MTPDARGTPLSIGDVVQVDPDSGSTFGGCLMIVLERLGWGVEGVIPVPDPMGARLEQYRAEGRDVVRIGAAAFRGR